MTQTFRYLSSEWTQEAHRRLREQLTPEQMKNITSSMVTLYPIQYACPEENIGFRYENPILIMEKGCEFMSKFPLSVDVV